MSADDGRPARDPALNFDDDAMLELADELADAQLADLAALRDRGRAADDAPLPLTAENLAAVVAQLPPGIEPTHACRATDADLARMQAAMEIGPGARILTATGDAAGNVELSAGELRAITGTPPGLRATAAAGNGPLAFNPGARVVLASGQRYPLSTDDKPIWSGVSRARADVVAVDPDARPVPRPPAPWRDHSADAKAAAEQAAIERQSRRTRRCDDCFGKGKLRRRRVNSVTRALVVDAQGAPVYDELPCHCVSGRGDPGRGRTATQRGGGAARGLDASRVGKG